MPFARWGNRDSEIKQLPESGRANTWYKFDITPSAQPYFFPHVVTPWEEWTRGERGWRETNRCCGERPGSNTGEAAKRQPQSPSSLVLSPGPSSQESVIRNLRVNKSSPTWSMAGVWRPNTKNLKLLRMESESLLSEWRGPTKGDAHPIGVEAGPTEGRKGWIK